MLNLMKLCIQWCTSRVFHLMECRCHKHDILDIHISLSMRVIKFIVLILKVLKGHESIFPESASYYDWWGPTWTYFIPKLDTFDCFRWDMSVRAVWSMLFLLVWSGWYSVCKRVNQSRRSKIFESKCDDSWVLSVKLLKSNTTLKFFFFPDFDYCLCLSDFKEGYLGNCVE